MRNVMREQLDALYDHEEPDDKLLTYLEAIDAELTNIAMLLKQKIASNYILLTYGCQILAHLYFYLCGRNMTYVNFFD